MGEKNIQLGAGKLFISTGDENCELLAEISEESELTVEVGDDSMPTDGVIKAFNDLGEITLTATISWDELMDAVYRVTETVFNTCPNRRVAHLAKHARKERTRKKNLRRAFRIAEKRG